MERKLVTLRTVKAITPIEGADKIELIHVDGWKVVAQKGLYEVGDTVVYFEVDSFLPILPEFEWLRKSSYRNNPSMGEGFLIKTIKLRGQISQGILMPVSEIAQMMGWATTALTNLDTDFEDLAKILGVKKWDPAPPIQMQQVAKGNFPTIIRKTDQERWQNLVDKIEVRQDEIWEVTEKLDGSSITVYYCDYTNPPDKSFGVCSRNYDLKPEGKFWETAVKLGLDVKLKKLGKNIALQGEMVGPGIQGNKYKLPAADIYFFDVWDIDQQQYLDPRARDLLLTALEVNQVPKLASQTRVNGEYLDKLWVGGTYPSALNQNTVMEGAVFKLYDLSFKAINPEFLLQEKE